jgi:hypothetical protein
MVQKAEQLHPKAYKTKTSTSKHQHQKDRSNSPRVTKFMIQERFLQHPMSMTKGHYSQDLELIYKKYTNAVCEMPSVC